MPQISSVELPKNVELSPKVATHVLKLVGDGQTEDLFLNCELLAEPTRFLDIETQQAIFWDLKSAEHHEETLELLGRKFDGVQGYFAYDNFEHGEVIQTHARFGRAVETAPYEVQAADIVLCSDLKIAKRYDVLKNLGQKGVFVLNSKLDGQALESQLPFELKQKLVENNGQLINVDAARLAVQLGLTVKQIMQNVFLNFASPKALTDALSMQIARSGAGTADVAKYHLTKALKHHKIDASWLEFADSDSGSEDSSEVPISVIVPKGTQISSSAFETIEREEAVKVDKWYRACLPFLFREHYKTEMKLRPDIDGHGPYLVTLTKNVRLTPKSYHRNIFHMEFDTTGTNLKYEIGDALGIHAHNDEAQVAEFLAFYELDGDDTVLLRAEDGSESIRSIAQVFTQCLDVFGRPNKRFYENMASWAKNAAEKARLRWIIGAEGTEEFKTRVEDTVTFASLLKEFPSAKPDVQDLLRAIPALKPRHYSIASSMKMNPNSVHLLVVLVDWKTSTGEYRVGQATNYLNNLTPNTKVTVSVMSSVLKLPPNHEDPVVMAGLGTGMAPFRAFVQERAALKAQGEKIGPMVLYFGARHRREEYLYGEELEAYVSDGVLTKLQLAFSRDQSHKVYIQHKIEEDKDLLNDYLKQKSGNFYLCGPTWPVPDVRKAITNGFVSNGMTDEDASNFLQKLKDDERYVLEVY